MQQGDVLLVQTDDGGDITVENGLVEMTGGIETTVYLSLFGGDEDGLAWWGDDSYTSNLQIALTTLPLITGNLVRFEQAAELDLADLGVQTTITASIPALNRLRITIDFPVLTAAIFANASGFAGFRPGFFTCTFCVFIILSNIL